MQAASNCLFVIAG